MVYYFWIIKGIKTANNFQKPKVHPKSVAYILLVFCQFQPAVAYESFAYKKRFY